MKKYDVVALGELLIDFTENGKSNQGNPLFEANPGGAPCNVLAMLTKLGHKTAFIGKVGEDFFGEQLRDAITEVGIDASGLCTDKEIHTTLAMVHTYPDGDRDFSFYRNPGADMMLNKEEICEELIKETKIITPASPAFAIVLPFMNCVYSVTKSSGTRETMLIRSTIEIPFPTPFSVIRSPIHIRNALPAVSVHTTIAQFTKLYSSRSP